MEEQTKYVDSDLSNERVYYLVKAKELKSTEQRAYGYMRSAIEKYEGPKDYIRGLSRHIFTEMSRAGLDYRNSWSKVVSDGEYIVMYKGISNQIFDAMGALALDGHMKIRVMAEDFAARIRKRYLVFMIE